MNRKAFLILITILSALTLSACGSSGEVGGGESIPVVLISVASDGTQADKRTANYKSVPSADGRFITFKSSATNLVANDANDLPDIFRSLNPL